MVQRPLLAVVLASACAPTPPTTAALAPQLHRRELSGPICAAPGPEVEATPTGFGFAGQKPPLGIQSYDVRVHNPRATPVWLVIAAFGEFPSGTTTIEVDRNETEPSVYRWKLESVATSGTGFTPYIESGLEAIRIAPETTVTLRGLAIETSATVRELPLSVLAELYIAQRPAADYLGHPAMLYGGQVTLENRWEVVIERRLEGPERVPTDVRVLCAVSVPTSNP
jgi:hypothetical protein